MWLLLFIAMTAADTPDLYRLLRLIWQRRVRMENAERLKTGDSFIIFIDRYH